jgi:phosphate transport system substrate-binding protein
MKLVRFFAPVFVLGVSIALVPTAQAQQVWKSIRIDGGSASAVFIKQAVVSFAKAKKIGVSVDQNGSTVAFQCLKAKECQIGMSTAEPAESEKDQFVRTLLGWDGLVVITSPDVGVANLSSEQIKNIYNGKIKNWKDVGGSDSPIKVFQREKIRGSRDFFDSSFKLSGESLGFRELGSNEQVINVMRREKSAIAYLGFGTAFSSGKGINILKIDGKVPTKETIASGVYPLRHPLLLFRLKELAADPTIESLVQEILNSRAEFFPKIGFIQ